MNNQFHRTEILIGTENLEKIKNQKIAIFGIGGVGSYVAEALARVGIQKFILIDNDKIDITNINRQIHATHETIGNLKVEEMKKRIKQINPQAQIETISEFVTEENIPNIIDQSIDYIVDAIDTVKSKIEIIKIAKSQNIPIISSMGTANKLEPTKLEVTDIYKTKTCPLAKIIRKELRKLEIPDLKIVYSTEEPKTTKQEGSKTLGSPVSGTAVPDPFADAHAPELGTETGRIGKPSCRRDDRPAGTGAATGKHGDPPSGSGHYHVHYSGAAGESQRFLPVCL